MPKFNYEGIDKNGRAITGQISAADMQEVRAQLRKFGFKNIQVEEAAPWDNQERPAGGGLPDDSVQKLVDSDIEVGEPLTEEEAEEAEWARGEVLAKIRRRRRRENIGVSVALAVIGLVAIYFIYDKVTEIAAPQPQIITKSGSDMLTFKDVYVSGQDLVFVVYSRNWNGNVRVDFKAWDAFDNEIDFGTARLGFIGEHYGATPEKSGTFKLKKYRFYERIEILVSGDEGK